MYAGENGDRGIFAASAARARGVQAGPPESKSDVPVWIDRRTVLTSFLTVVATSRVPPRPGGVLMSITRESRARVIEWAPARRRARRARGSRVRGCVVRDDGGATFGRPPLRSGCSLDTSEHVCIATVSPTPSDRRDRQTADESNNTIALHVLSSGATHQHTP